MNSGLERSINQIISLGMQQIRMLFIESQIAMAKQEGQINDEEYEVYRQVADKNWDKWSKKVERERRK